MGFPWPFWAALVAVSVGSVADAQDPPPEGARAVAFTRRAGDRIDAGLLVRAARGRAFRWEVSVDSPRGPWVALGVRPLTGGRGRAELRVPADFAARDLYFRAVWHDGDAVVTTPPVLGGFLEEPIGDAMDMSWGLGGVALSSGTNVSSTQPWSDFVTILARNHDPNHPDAVVLVDESRWEIGGAGPPGPARAHTLPKGPPGAGSGTGKLLTVARDTVDADHDGFVDDPRPEPAGGELIFLFAGPTRAPFVSVFDVDEPGGSMRAFAGPTLLGEVPLPVAGDREFQQLSVPGAFSLITKLVVEFAGSGGLDLLSTIPCPAALGFDETTTGVPLERVAGEGVGTAYSAIGLFDGFVTATNQAPGGPDLALLYDTGDPGAAQPELATPGPGIGNDTPLRKVLVIAGNDVDADDDGVVDVPSASTAGGWLSLGWVTSDVFFRSATVVDIDADETGFVRVFDDMGGFTDLPLTSLGDNSVQTVAADLGPTRQIELFASGTAALAEVRICSD